MSLTIRPPAVAGQFYPADPQELRELVNGYLGAVQAPASSHSVETGSIKGLIVPHAGYVYSGGTAAQVYQRLRSQRDTVRRIVMVGPAHRVPFAGIGISGATGFQTPLGMVPVDEAARQMLLSSQQVTIQDAAHAPEHSLEVQLPFLQSVLDDFAIVPLIYSRADYRHLAAVLESLWGGPETLLLISSDLSHYLNESSCRHLDSQTANIIEQLDIDALDRDTACGQKGIQALMELAQRHHCRIRRLALETSAKAFGDTSRVVGYGAFVMEPSPTPQPTEQG